MKKTILVLLVLSLLVSFSSSTFAETSRIATENYLREMICVEKNQIDSRSNSIPKPNGFFVETEEQFQQQVAYASEIGIEAFEQELFESLREKVMEQNRLAEAWLEERESDVTRIADGSYYRYGTGTQYIPMEYVYGPIPSLTMTVAYERSFTAVVSGSMITYCHSPYFNLFGVEPQQTSLHYIVNAQNFQYISESHVNLQTRVTLNALYDVINSAGSCRFRYNGPLNDDFHFIT